MTKKQASVCDKDCFNCKFPDCIYEGLDAQDYRESSARDKILTQTPEQKKMAAYQRAYYEANREKVAAQQQGV